MRNTVAKIVQHTKNGRISYIRMVIACIEMFNSCQGYIRILTLITLCLSSLLSVHTAQAQEAILDAGTRW
jgi:hypothetical protein